MAARSDMSELREGDRLTATIVSERRHPQPRNPHPRNRSRDGPGASGSGRRQHRLDGSGIGRDCRDRFLDFEQEPRLVVIAS